jgi:hypothetical protein
MPWRSAPAAFSSHPLIAGADAEDVFFPGGALGGAGGVAGGALESLLEASAVPPDVGGGLGACPAAFQELLQAVVHFILLGVHLLLLGLYAEQLLRHFSLLALHFHEHLQ